MSLEGLLEARLWPCLGMPLTAELPLPLMDCPSPRLAGRASTEGPE